MVNPTAIFSFSVIAVPEVQGVDEGDTFQTCFQLELTDMAPFGTITVTVMLDSPGKYYDFYVHII